MDQVMDLNPKQKQLTSYHNAGYIPIPLKGKVPCVKGWQDSRYDLDIDLATFPENFGVVLQSDDLVVDVDPRNFPKGDKVWKRFAEDFDIKNISDRVVVRTGSGGYHLYFKKPADIPVRENLDIYPGIEFKSKGRQVVGAGCIHPDTGSIYELVAGDLSKVPEIPAALLEVIKATNGKKKEHIAATEKYADRTQDVTRFISFLENAEPAIEGEQGDSQTYSVACEARALGLSPQKCFELMREYYNPRCRPVWPDDELKEKVRNAYKYAQGEAGEKTPEKDFKPVPGPEIVTWDGVGSNRKKTIHNAVNCFIVGGDKNPLFRTLSYCEFSGRVMVDRPMPWDNANSSFPRQWTDSDSTELRHFIGSGPLYGRIDFTKQLLGEAVLKVGRFKITHPIRDYLNGLKWDGVERLDKWLIDYCGATDSPYTREVGKNTLIQAVARAYHPGCRADHVLILEGAQGIGKSSVVRILGGDYYADIVIDAHDRDTVDAMRGAWFIEFSEMEITRRQEAQALKAFITRTTDRCRLAYMQFSFDYPRSCIFIGTINPDALGEYLSDSTGNRRFWPVACSHIQLAALKKDRDQLFAEAVTRYKKGEVYHIEDKHVLKEAMAEQDRRQSRDSWQEIIQEYLDTNELNLKTGIAVVKDIWLYALRGSESGFNKGHAHRIADVLRKLGYEYGCQWNPIAKSHVKCFRKMEIPGHDIQSDPLFS